MGSMAPPFDLADLPTGVAMPLSPMVARVLAPNPSPFTFTGTQTYVVGSSDVAVIDPGPDEADHLTALTAAIAGRPVVAIVCTHTHRDHSPAAQPLRAMTGAPVIGCAPLTLDDDGPRADAAFDAAYRPDRILADGERLAGEGWTLEAVATPGHTSNHLCFALVEEQALFTGDHVMGWSTSIIAPPDGNMRDYMASLARLLTREDELYWPTHGPCIPNPKEFVKGYIQHRQNREKQVLMRLAAGDTRITAMVEVMYADVDKKLHPAAALSVFAHMQDLVARNRVSCSGKPALDSEFTLV